jgi:hypothetical protein
MLLKSYYMVLNPLYLFLIRGFFTAVPLTFSHIVWDELGVVFLGRMPHDCMDAGGRATQEAKAE